MPSTTKTLYFLSCALVTALAFGLLAFGISTDWSKTTMECARLGSDFINGTAVVTLSIFTGTVEREDCPAFEQSDSFQVVPKLTETGGAPVVLHGLTSGLCVICLIFSALSIIIALYNSVSNPYETFMGPIGIYVSSSASTILSAAIISIFLANVLGTDMIENVATGYAGTNEVRVRMRSSEVRVGFYLVIPYAVLSLIAIALIYKYEHAAYAHRKEQQKPTEDAPKEIMMY